MLYWRKINQCQLEAIRDVSTVVCKFFRFQYPVDYLHPKVKNVKKTEKYLHKLKEWSHYTHETLFTEALVDYKLSKGNFIVDHDGNRILDLSMQGGLLPLGYNPGPLIDTRAARSFDRYLNQTPNLSEYPPMEYVDFVRDSILPIAPKGLSEIYFTDGIGGLANEAAIKIALLKYKETRGGISEIDWDNFASNDLSNSSDLLQNNVCVLGFQNCFYGKTLAGQSASGAGMIRSTAPTYDWPTAPMPEMKYPYNKYSVENQIEEDRCINEVKSIIKERENMGCPVGAMIIEPITFLKQSVATPTYYQKLRAIASEHGIPFIVDETRTGVGKTAKMWAHEHWYLDEAPDIVTFGGSAHASGVFTRPEFRPLELHKLTTVGNGSMEKIVAFKSIIDHIKRKRLLEKTQDTGDFIKTELDRVNKKQRVFTNLRGHGTFLGFDVEDFHRAQHLQKYLLRNGIMVAMVGPQTLGLRPSLLLEPLHAAHLRDAIQNYHPELNMD